MSRPGYTAQYNRSVTPEVSHLLVRLSLAGPVLYIALLMTLDPGAFFTFASTLAWGLQNFQQGLRGGWRHAAPYESFSASPSRRARIAVRMTGVALAALALVHIALG